MQNVNRKCLVTPFLWAIGAATTEQVGSPHLCTPAQLRLKHPLSLWGFSWRWSSANTIVLLRYSKTALLLIKHCPIQTFAEWSTTWKRMVNFMPRRLNGRSNSSRYPLNGKWSERQNQAGRFGGEKGHLLLAEVASWFLVFPARSLIS